MKPVQFDLKINPEALVTRAEEHLHFLRERNTYFENAKVEGVSVPVPVLRYKIFDAYPELVVGFSTRLGGVSKGYLGSMNLSFTRGDEEASVMENHRRFAQACGYDYTKLVFSDQVHKTNLRIVTKDDCGKGIVRERDFSEIDGLITQEVGIPLMTFYADCVPLFLYDPVQRVIATAHSGWRGTVGRIGMVVVQKMQELYGSKPEDIICAIGPSICKACYEVSKDVADACGVYTEEQRKILLEDKGNGKYQLDLHQACYYNFTDAGVLSEHIALPDICTCCNPELLFSHRASGGRRGNLGGVIMLCESTEECRD
ncbi:peptidoglycan editing factor PgeF [Wujia sp.]|uniref:peptidoglycan editing factor PgeF n=1 Tax=Wujia sp. TaxID=2944172 RepID=UPI003F7DEB26